jgi:hypothetical protein
LKNPELAEIEASLQTIVRRAYDLGRNEALKRVVEVLSTDRPADQLALMAPEDTAPGAPHDTASNREERSEKAPWWAWPVK